MKKTLTQLAHLQAIKSDFGYTRSVDTSIYLNCTLNVAIYFLKYLQYFVFLLFKKMFLTSFLAPGCEQNFACKKKKNQEVIVTEDFTFKHGPIIRKKKSLRILVVMTNTNKQVFSVAHHHYQPSKKHKSRKSIFRSEKNYL